MPLTIRAISPVNLSLNRINDDVQRDELQCFANGTLANLIRQLSSLSKNAEQLFNEVHHEVLKIDHKANTLFLRMERLTQKIQQPDLSHMESASLEENHMRKAYRSTNIIDQHSLDRQTLPATLADLYQRCDPPPDLNQLNAYRDNPQQDALTLYTNPGYFFDLWKQEMLKEIGRTSRSAAITGGVPVISKSPARARKQRQQQQLYQPPISYHNQKQQTIYHSSTSISYHNFENKNDNMNDNNCGATRQALFSSSGNHCITSSIGGVGQHLQFPAEYQAPQNLLKMNSNGRIQPPPGMSLQAIETRSNTNRNAGPPPQQENAAYQQKQRYNGQQQILIAQQKKQQDEQQKCQHKSTQNLQTNLQDASIEGETTLCHSQQCDQQQRLKLDAKTKTSTAPDFGGFLEEDEDDELPPPPPALSSHTTMMSASDAVSTNFDRHKQAEATDFEQKDQQLFYSASNLPGNNRNGTELQNAMQFVPTGTANNNQTPTKQGQNTPPPSPPPPPPAPLFGAKSGSFAQEETSSKSLNVEKENDTTTTATHSNLLLQIQRGKQLKKVQIETEMAQKRSTESNDVAAILRRRMEHILGNDDDEESNNDEDDGEWDD